MHSFFPRINPYIIYVCVLLLLGVYGGRAVLWPSVSQHAAASLTAHIPIELTKPRKLALAGEPRNRGAVPTHIPMTVLTALNTNVLDDNFAITPAFGQLWNLNTVQAVQVQQAFDEFFEAFQRIEAEHSAVQSDSLGNSWIELQPIDKHIQVYVQQLGDRLLGTLDQSRANAVRTMLVDQLRNGGSDRLQFSISISEDGGTMAIDQRRLDSRGMVVSVQVSSSKAILAGADAKRWGVLMKFHAKAALN